MPFVARLATNGNKKHCFLRFLILVRWLLRVFSIAAYLVLVNNPLKLLQLKFNLSFLIKVLWCLNGDYIFYYSAPKMKYFIHYHIYMLMPICEQQRCRWVLQFGCPGDSDCPNIQWNSRFLLKWAVKLFECSVCLFLAVLWVTMGLVV